MYGDIKISFIIPVYNAQQYLKDCVDSILNQDYKNIEIILVNDGSTDESGLICDNYSKEYFFIKTINKKNGGVASARNAGLTEATGDYVFFIDNDDWLGEKKLNSLVKIIQNNKPDIIINKYNIFEEKKISFGNAVIDKNFVNQKAPEDVLNYFRKKRINIMAPWEYVVKREVINKNSLSFNINQNGVDDSVFTPILFCNCKTFFFNEDAIYFWRQRSNSQSKTHKKSDYILKMISTIESLEEYSIKVDKEYKKDYIYFSLYKNLFALFGQYYNYTLEDRQILKEYFFNKLKLIKKVVKCSGFFHNLLSTIFGYFWGMILGYEAAKIKGKFYLFIFKVNKR